MIGLSQQDIASFRDERLRSVAPSTAARELAILSHVIEVAIRDWGLPTLEKRIETIKAWGEAFASAPSSAQSLSRVSAPSLPKSAKGSR